MAEIINTFLRGKMNQDLDSRILPNGEYREATNLSISRSESSTVGQFENILGNTKISELVAATGTEIIGSFVDENSNTAYLFATDWSAEDGERAPSTAECYIFSVDLSVSNQPTILVQGSFLNFNKFFILTGINLIENLLFFTDNLNQPRKINVIESSSFENYYTNEDQISVAKYAPYEPILVMERNTTTVSGATPLSATITPGSMTGIKVGDIITNNNKIDTLDIENLVTVIGIPTAATLTLSEAVLVPDSTIMDFSRPSMTNQASLRMANHSEGLIDLITGGASPDNPITTSYKIEGSGVGVDWLYNGKNGIPRIGDLVSCSPNPSRIPADTRIASVEILDDGTATNPSQSISVTLNKETQLVASIDTLSISDNPDHDANWSGDVDFLEDKFIRFSYRFKFNDNEYSLMAPWSQVMFIPKQYSQFGGGNISPTEDMNDAYKSTIVAWFENNINNILLKIPMPYTSGPEMSTELRMTDIDILFKESDGLTVKVLETIALPTVSTAFPTISFYDSLNGIDAVKSFLDYNYTSTKPYKTLPSNQITRVSDKVPVRALAQEVIGNRIVYGNYRDRHTAPSSIDFSAVAGNKSTRYDNYTQYPKHQLKQNRTYQVGFVLSDRYGRQSDVILSSYDGNPNIAGSSVFHPYNKATDQDAATPLTDWLGDALKVQLDTAINSTASFALGTPGLYSSTNPLGWFSYKIVVKQQEQEYYNVYLPGFINGYPVEEKVETNKSFFTTLISDNINKVPRDLKEVGPSDSEYNSSEILTIRVNNPDISNKPISTNYVKDTPWNTQYFTGNLSQRVLSIATTRDMEIQAIPFKPGVTAGKYGESAILQVYHYVNNDHTLGVENINETPEPTGKIPWGKTAPDSPIYNADSNPLVVKINQSANINNPIGGSVFPDSINTVPPAQTLLSTVPFLSIAETKPVYSLLDIYWETSLSGNLATLNSLVNSQYAGIVGADFVSAVFNEDAAGGSLVGNEFDFLNSTGTAITTGITLNSFTITDAVGSTIPAGVFTLAETGGGATTWEIRTATGKTFFYNTSVAATPSTGIYTLTANVTYNGFTDDIVLNSFSLGNISPVVTGEPLITVTGLTTASTSIYTFAAVNGSADATLNTDQLVWSLDPAATNFSTVNTQFEFLNSSIGALTVKTAYTLVDAQPYTVSVLATDVNGVGPGELSGGCDVTFTPGTQHVNLALCEGYQGGVVTNCNEALQVQFLDSATVSALSSSVSVTGSGVTQTYPATTSSETYNVLARNPGGADYPLNPYNTTGELKQGSLWVQGTLTNTTTEHGGDTFVWYTIQVKPTSGGGWQQAQDTNYNSVVYNNKITTGSSSSQSGIYHIFTQPGEYRILTTVVTGTLCQLSSGASDTTIVFNFGEANFSGSCTNAPV